MKITEVRLGLISVPLRVPFKTALRSVSSVEDVIVEIHTDTGAVGYGEAPPTGVITGDTTGAIIGAIRDHIAKTIIGRDVTDCHPPKSLAQVQALVEAFKAGKGMTAFLQETLGQDGGADTIRGLVDQLARGNDLKGDMLQRFTEDLTELQRAIRRGNGEALFDKFTETRAIRRSIIEQGQDDSRADFGRSDH